MIIEFELSLDLELCPMSDKESVFVSGSLRCLGQWNALGALEMKPKSDVLSDKG